MYDFSLGFLGESFNLRYYFRVGSFHLTHRYATFTAEFATKELRSIILPVSLALSDAIPLSVAPDIIKILFHLENAPDPIRL